VLGLVGHAGLISVHGPATLAAAIYVATLGIATGLCVYRTVLVSENRPQWLLFGAGLLTWVIGFATYDWYVQGQHPQPYPSLADAGWLSFYPLIYAGLIVSLRGRLTRFHSSMVLDGALGSLALGAVGAAVILPTVLRTVGGVSAAVLTAIAYPVGDFVLLGFLFVLLAANRWRFDRVLAPLAFALGLEVVVDSVYVYRVASGTFVSESLLFDAWLLIALAIAWAAWQRPARERRVAMRTSTELTLPAAFTLIALSLLVYGSFSDVDRVAAVLAALALLVAIGRLILSLHEAHLLGELATRDALTNLLNHREFHVARERETASTQEGQQLSLVSFDLDGFKEINDTQGHAEGDRILRRFAGALAAATRSSDWSCRTGGDEFALILTEAGNDEAAEIAQRLIDKLGSLEPPIEASYGLATWPRDAQTKEMLLLRADVALYDAKRSKARSGGSEPIAAHTEFAA